MVFLLIIAVVLTAFLPAAKVSAAIPSAPFNLYGIVIDAGRVELHWTDSSVDETGFNIQRAPDIGGLEPGTWSTIATVAADTTMYTDDTVAGKQGYWYRIFATNVDGNSFPSNVVSIRMPLSAPTISLVAPTSPPATITSGEANAIEALALDSGATVTSVNYQFIADNPPGVFDARDIYSIPMDLTILAPRAPAPVDNADVMPAMLPAGAVAEYEIRGTVSVYDAGTGTWQIGNPPITVYESVIGDPLSTKFVGARMPMVGDAVKIVAYRTTDVPSPLVAKTITFIQPAQPPAAPALTLCFLYNGKVASIDDPVIDMGYLISGETWHVSEGMFRVDAPYFPAYIDANVDVGMNITVRFGEPPAEANVAREIFPQVIKAIPPPINQNPIFDYTPAPSNVAFPGSWLFVIVDGVVKDKDLVKHTWTIGEEEVMVYEASGALIEPATAGDEVLCYCRRTLVPGPLVAEQINNILPGPLVQPLKGTAVETHLMVNGPIQTIGPNTWTIGGHTFVVDDPEGKADIDSGPFASLKIGDLVTVRYDHVGEMLPDPGIWAPLTEDTVSGTWKTTMTPPATTAAQTGTLFLQVGDSLQAGSITTIPATLEVPPPIHTDAASAVGPDTATLNGTLLDMGGLGAVNVAFEWGETVAYGNTTPLQSMAAPGAFSEVLTGLTPNTTYHYRAMTEGGTAYGDDMVFTTASVSSNRPLLISPANGSIVAGTSINYEWTPVPGSTKYWLKVWRASDGVVKFRGDIGNVTTYTDSGYPNDGTMYNWRVWPGDAGGWGPVSATWVFANGGSVAPVIPVTEASALIAPVNFSGVAATSVNFEWGAVANATKYWLKVTRVSDGVVKFRADLGNVTNYTDTGYPNDDTLYEWRVWAGNDLGWGPVSTVWTFLNGPGTPPIPVTASSALVAPADGSNIADTSINYEWGTVANATKYWLKVTRVSDGVVKFRADLGNVTTYTDAGYPNDGTVYEWKVWAGSDLGWGPVSTIWTFTNGP